MRSKKFYRPELDILRFFCFLLVFVHHILPRDVNSVTTAFAEAAGFGVPVFFLLSSYLITELLLREREQTATVHIGSFYVRRILRIWPLYFGFFAFCWAMGKAHVLMAAIPWTMTLYYLLLAGNWYMVLHGPIVNAAGVLWSVSIEEQFYLCWPLLTRVAGARAVRVVSIIVIFCSYLSLWLLARHSTNPDTSLWANTFVQMQFFAIGGLLALYLGVKKPVFSPLARAFFLFLMTAAWFCSAYYCRIKKATDLHTTPAHACFGYLLVAVGATSMFLAFYGFHFGQGRLAKIGVYLGKISYGLYVFHIFGIWVAQHSLKRLHLLPITVPVTLVSSFAVTVTLAILSYKFFETPFLRLKEQFTFVHSRSI